MNSYMQDSRFLLEIDKMRIKEKYARITVLDFFNEKPIENIEAKITQGSINIVKDSPMRRTASLTMILEESVGKVLSVNNLISINKKIQLEIGLRNLTNLYPENKIIWFKQGIFIISDLNITRSPNAATISLSLRDKMCLLNGDMGGTITSTVDFDKENVYDENGVYLKGQKVKIFKIIQNLVGQYGGEQLGRILINDIPDQSIQLVQWGPRGATEGPSLYLTKQSTGRYISSTKLPSGFRPEDGDIEVKQGEIFGYHLTDTVCPSGITLTASPGDSVCTILDKLKGLGNYEYFYDINGNFVFQEIKDYRYHSKASFDITSLNNNSYIVDREKGKASYIFDDATLITSYTNTPKYNMIKNDFVVWGKRKIGQSDIDIRYHLAIDEKPQVGTKHDVVVVEDEKGNYFASKPIVITTIDPNSPEYFPGLEGRYYIIDNGVKTYYTWKKVYEDDNNEKTYNYQYAKVEIPLEKQSLVATDWRTELYLQGVEVENDGAAVSTYYKELKNEWPKMYDIVKGTWKVDKKDMTYFLDFIDSNAKISELSVSNIGLRPRSEQKTNINCIFTPDIPARVVLNAAADNLQEQIDYCLNNSQEYVIVEDKLYSDFTVIGSYSSAFDEIKALLYTHTSYNETISITALPVYYLQPNTRITTIDPLTSIYGDFIINSISLPLEANGTMTLACSRAIDAY